MNILVVCTGNTCRSPMAAAMLREMLKNAGHTDIIVKSAGTMAFEGSKASRHAVEAMAEKGIDLKSHRSVQLTQSLLQEADRILVMTQPHKGILTLDFGQDPKKITVLDVPDPYGGSLDDYRRCRDAIEAALTRYLEALK